MLSQHRLVSRPVTRHMIHAGACEFLPVEDWSMRSHCMIWACCTPRYGYIHAPHAVPSKQHGARRWPPRAKRIARAFELRFSHRQMARWLRGHHRPLELLEVVTAAASPENPLSRSWLYLLGNSPQTCRLWGVWRTIRRLSWAGLSTRPALLPEGLHASGLCALGAFTRSAVACLSL